MRWWWMLAAAGAVGTVACVALHVQGVGGYATHPVSAASLAAGGVLTARIAGDAPARVRAWLMTIAISLTATVILAAVASAAPIPLTLALWAVAWMPLTGLITVLGLAAGGLLTGARACAAIIAAVTIGGALVLRPAATFPGVATVAPDAADPSVPALADALILGFAATLVTASAIMIVRAARALASERQRALTCAAVTAGGPGLVLVCVALAVLADPGDLDARSASVAYLVAIPATATVAARATVTSSRWALRTMLASWAAAALVLMAVASAPLWERTATLGAALVVLVAVASASGFVLGMRALERWAAAPRLRLVGGVVPGLSPRENEVLALVADGATNAGIAASLFVSERTVEQHLRSIFTKLQLGPAEGSNRRVRAAAVWWGHRGRAESAPPAEAAGT